MKLRVIIIDEDAGRAALLERALLDSGYEVAAKISEPERLVESVNRLQPDVIIIDLESPDRDTLEQMHSINREQPRPVVMFADKGDSDTITEAVRAGVSAYVVDGMDTRRIRPILDVAIARFREYQALKDELAQTKNTLAERKEIERAKGILMSKRGWGEEEAYQALRKMAMDQNKRLGEVARNVVEMAALFE